MFLFYILIILAKLPDLAPGEEKRRPALTADGKEEG
jgi:hypothetical protein